MRTSPRSGSSSPAISRSSVVFPDPEAPTTQREDPPGTARSTPSRAGTELPGIDAGQRFRLHAYPSPIALRAVLGPAIKGIPGRGAPDGVWSSLASMDRGEEARPPNQSHAAPVQVPEFRLHPPAGRGPQPAQPLRGPALEPDPEAPPEAPGATLYLRDRSASLITTNSSPDIPFEASINPYRGCEHGCVYCYARPTHEYLGFSPGLDFETRILVKEEAPALLRRELSSRRWKPRPLAMSGVTDPYSRSSAA